MPLFLLALNVERCKCGSSDLNAIMLKTTQKTIYTYATHVQTRLLQKKIFKPWIRQYSNVQLNVSVKIQSELNFWSSEMFFYRYKFSKQNYCIFYSETKEYVMFVIIISRPNLSKVHHEITFNVSHFTLGLF